MAALPLYKVLILSILGTYQINAQQGMCNFTLNFCPECYHLDVDWQMDIYLDSELLLFLSVTSFYNKVVEKAEVLSPRNYRFAVTNELLSLEFVDAAGRIIFGAVITF